jgi:hypothetical protein
MHLERFAAIKLVLSIGLAAISSSSGASSVESKYAPVNWWFPQNQICDSRLTILYSSY